MFAHLGCVVSILSSHYLHCTDVNRIHIGHSSLMTKCGLVPHRIQFSA